jgi:hypothetical protein
METANMMDYFKELSKHVDPRVREAAVACIECYGSPKWRSRTMRKLLGNLSWALYDYTKANIKRKVVA